MLYNYSFLLDPNILFCVKDKFDRARGEKEASCVLFLCLLHSIREDEGSRTTGSMQPC
jgi:hypothetical protein